MRVLSMRAEWVENKSLEGRREPRARRSGIGEFPFAFRSPKIAFILLN
jgi:hypothetical protein